MEDLHLHVGSLSIKLVLARSVEMDGLGFVSVRSFAIDVYHLDGAKVLSLKSEGVLYLV